LKSTSALLGACLALGIAGCTATGPVAPPGPDPALADCERLFATVDALVEGAGVRDGAAAPVPGFPYLRVERFLASYRDEPLRGEQLDWWLGRLRELDREARRIELANLPSQHRAGLPPALRAAADPLTPLERCARGLSERDRQDPGRVARLRAAAEVPDDYQGWKRALGLYPLTAIAFLQGVARYQTETRATFAQPLDAPPSAGRLIRYEPRPGPPPRAALEEILDRSGDNPLGIPLPAGRDLEALFAAHAPVLEVKVVDRNDRIGRPVLTATGTARVDTSRPVVFTRTAHTRFQGKPLLQLVYSVWFPARPRTGPIDLLGGHLDGITWRVTLDTDGGALAYDTMHNCGCYHMFFPTARVSARQRPTGLEEPPLILPGPGRCPPGQRVRLRVASGTHYLQDVGCGLAGATATPSLYTLVADDRLRSLPVPAGGRRSLFEPNGIVAGSERGERYLFWPMGVREPGAMRQWGRHATAFVGRRHFDDPHLIERYFRPSPATD
jgi:hypothetical protein